MPNNPAMSIDHYPIPGTPEHVEEGASAVQHRLLHFWGLKGAGLLNGQRKHRSISVRHVLHAQFTAAQIESVKQGLAAAAGRTGTLIVTSTNWNGTYKDCLFLGWEALPEPENGPLPDAAGTLDGGWWQRLVFHFLQITTNP